MKIPLSIRSAYEEQEEQYKRLKDLVDTRMASLRKPRWHYESRIKQMDSFCLKLESGRFKDARNLEDFFACTIVVPNITEIEIARNCIDKEFQIASQRPADEHFTHKRPESFPFDDLRLYVNLKIDPIYPTTELEHITFEIQVKTFLQHAWAISTHDLVYKTDDVNWSKQRIAYQIKAMLEHAELSIYEAESISKSLAILKTDRATEDIMKIISILKVQWKESDLPADLRRLAGNVHALLIALKINISDLESILNKAMEDNNGALPLNLSPYGVIIQAIIMQKKDKIAKYLTTENKDKQKPMVLIASEIGLPHEISQDECVNAIFIGERI